MESYKKLFIRLIKKGLMKVEDLDNQVTQGLITADEKNEILAEVETV